MAGSAGDAAWGSRAGATGRSRGGSSGGRRGHGGVGETGLAWSSAVGDRRNRDAGRSDGGSWVVHGRGDLEAAEGEDDGGERETHVGCV